MNDNEILIYQKIHYIRGSKVMLDYDLAILYGTQTMRLNEAVKRNNNRFPSDFMFQLSKNEEVLISQIAISKKGGRRRPPYAFTELGVAMLSSVLKTEIAIEVNIKIMRVFNRLREMISEHKELKEKIETLEKKYDGQFEFLFKAIYQMVEDEKSHGSMGFRTKD